VRAEVSPTFAVAVKLNAGDFQRGGFDAGDAKAVVEMLNELDVDLVELSGGSVESPAMQGRTANGVQLDKEADFLSMAEDIVTAAHMPIMLTGGIQRQDTAQRVLDRASPWSVSAATMARDRHQLHRVAAGRRPQPNVSALRAFVQDQVRRRKALKSYTAWLRQR
jgi:2,4-dienoyl-CoA reductase-like NADH-dependent reductase (Old Yellow Enzyme family)